MQTIRRVLLLGLVIGCAPGCGGAPQGKSEGPAKTAAVDAPKSESAAKEPADKSPDGEVRPNPEVVEAPASDGIREALDFRNSVTEGDVGKVVRLRGTVLAISAPEDKVTLILRGAQDHVWVEMAGKVAPVRYGQWVVVEGKVKRSDGSLVEAKLVEAKPIQRPDVVPADYVAIDAADMFAKASADASAFERSLGTIEGTIAARPVIVSGTVKALEPASDLFKAHVIFEVPGGSVEVDLVFPEELSVFKVGQPAKVAAGYYVGPMVGTLSLRDGTPW